MNIDCNTCRARYHVDSALFKGAKGMRVRCRRCGNSLYVLNPGEISSDRNAVNDTSTPWNPSDNSGIEPAVSLAGQEQSTPPEMARMLPEGEPAPRSQEDGEKEESLEELFRKPLPASGYPNAPFLFYPPLPKSTEKARSRRKFRWSSLFFRCIFLLLAF